MMVSNFGFGQQQGNTKNPERIRWTPWQTYSTFPSSNLDCSNQSWKLVYYDEFEGTAINTSDWYTFSPDGGVNCSGTDNCFWARARGGGNFWGLFMDDNVEVDNGMLKLHVKKEPNTWFGVNFNYSAGVIWAKQDFQYGKFEARIKMHKGGGFFPAFWLTSSTEMDIIEYPGGKTPKKYGITLWGQGSTISDIHQVTDVNGNVIDFSQGFHVYSAEWTPHKAEFFVDGYLVREFYRYQRKLPIGVQGVDCDTYQSSGKFRESLVMSDASKAIVFNTSVMFDEDKYGAIKDSDFPSTMEVDYIRVYQKTPQQGKYDLCGGTIEGLDDICYGGQETYTFSGDYSNVTWTTSSNLNIIGTTANTVTVSPTTTGFSTGWIKATVDFIHAPCSTKTFIKNVQTGELINGTINLNNSSQPLQTVNFISGNSGNSYTTFNVDLDNTANTYNWQITSGNGTIGGTNWNPQLITIPPNSTSLSCEISTTTDCGIIARTVAFVISSGWYRISPNPANNYLNIATIADYEVEHSSDTGELTKTLIQPSFSKVTLFNFYTAEQVFEQNAFQPIKQMTVDIGHLPKGKYLLKITNELNTSTHQIIIE
jgi:beta-glucanase (GH16 family)